MAQSATRLVPKSASDFGSCFRVLSPVSLCGVMKQCRSLSGKEFLQRRVQAKAVDVSEVLLSHSFALQSLVLHGVIAFAHTPVLGTLNPKP